jgi:uncharacterized protein with GYD domain
VTEVEAAMATYLVLFTFTPQGMERIKDSPARVKVAKDTIRQMGGDVQAFYAILGSQYDTLFIVSAPNDEKIAEMVLAISSLGNVHTETHRLFNDEEFAKIISSLP